MLTPARRHFESVMAQNRGTAANTLADMTAYEQMLHRLRVDRNRLKGIQNKKIKAVVKREILPNYQGWIDGVLASDSGQADLVFTTVMLWNIDAGNIAEALRLGEYAIRHKLSMGDNFDRTPAVVLVDEISDPVLAHFKAGQADAPVSADLLKGLDGLTANEDVPEPVRAKLWKAIGYTLRTSADTQVEALDYLRKAIAEFSDIGVKRDIENLERLVKAAAAVSGESDSAEIPRSAVTAVTVIEGEAVPLAAGPVVLSPESGNAAAEVTVPAAESSAAEQAAKPPAKRGRPAGTKAAAVKKPAGVAKARTGAAKTAKPQ
jgi:hypothetical protein